MAAGLSAQLRRSLRLVWIALLAPVSLVEALFIAAAGVLSPRLRARVQPPMMQAWCGWLARIWGVRISVRGEPVAAPAMLACNHRSWLDIVVLGAVVPGAFISKAEIDHWPIIGYLARHGGRTLFISRGEMRSFKKLGGNLIERLKTGERVIFFPEGGVSGERLLLRFRPRLFAAAVAADCPVQPVAIDYCGGDGAARAALRVGEPFALHAWRLMRLRGVDVSLTFAPAMETRARSDKELAAQAHAAVAAIVSPAPQPEGGAFADTLGAVERRSKRDG